ncbi:MAG: hypothetical protein GC192_01405 [Bacteroidetes bacterium]|nr:hypothetical protein [Bacteroidota bacterium]
MNTPQKGNPPPKKLVEGIDFTIENGLYVFTAYYLKKRGYCCENGCRNCPYGFRKQGTVRP